MGTMLHIIASDAIMEQIAAAQTGSAAAVRAIEAEFTTAFAALDLRDDEGYEAADAVRNAKYVALGDPAAGALENLMLGQGFQRFQSCEWARENGHSDYSGGTTKKSEMLTLLERQLRWADRVGPILGNPTDEQIHESREAFRARIYRAIEFVKSDDITEVYWS